MATKKVTAVIKLQCPAGAATPAPPIGPALGPHGVSAPKFVQEFNDRTKSMEKGLIIPVVISVYSDKSFTFILKTPPAADLLLKAAGIQKGSENSKKHTVAKISRQKYLIEESYSKNFFRNYMEKNLNMEEIMKTTKETDLGSLESIECKILIKGDAKSYNIASASILAKVLSSSLFA